MILLIYPRISENLIKAASVSKVFSQLTSKRMLRLLDSTLKVHRKRLSLKALVAENSCNISKNVILYSYITSRSPGRSNAVEHTIF